MKTPPSRPNLTGQLATFCANRALHLTFTQSAIREAELAITDTVGCILAGVDDPAVVKLGRTVPDEEPGGSRRSHSVRHAHTVSTRDAAAINGCAAHARELDDNVMPAVIHSSAVLTPSLLALGEEICATGADIVRAFIVGKEVNAQIGKLVNPGHYEAGWNANLSIGVFGAAAAAATLLKLDREQAAHALSIAFSMASGTNLQFGTEVKPLHCGLAASWGIWAAQLAQQGMEGNTDVLQGKWSFQELYAGTTSEREHEVKLFPDAPLAIDEYPPVTKLYPCCGSSHLGIDALRSLRAKHDLDPNMVARVDVHMVKQMTENLCHDFPANELEARFSMPYCAALTLVHGMPTLAHFDPAAVAHPDPAVERLLPLVRKHVRNPSPEVLSRKLIFVGDCLVEIHLRDGSVLHEIAEHPKGCRENPLTAEERRTKFLDCSVPVLGQARAESIYAELQGIYRLESTNGITRALGRLPSTAPTLCSVRS